MFDHEIVMDSLQKIRTAIETILERASVVSDPNDLLCSPGGMMRLDAVFVLFALIVASSLTSLDSFRSTRQMVSEDMDRALAITMQEQQSDVIS